jgi:hypothetical protein
MFGNIIEEVNSACCESIADEDLSTNKIPPLCATIPTSGKVTLVIEGGGGSGTITIFIRIG